MDREELFSWLNPPFKLKDSPVPPSAGGEAANQTLGAATSLQLVRKEGPLFVLQEELPDTYAEFSDQVHERLAMAKSSDPDHVILRAFAWAVTEIDRQATTNFLQSDMNSLADNINASISDAAPQTERAFNPTKLPPWRRWLIFLGLAVELPSDGFYPYITDRLWRELTYSGLQTHADIPFKDVMSIIGKRMPYIDGGALWKEFAGPKNKERSSVSRVLSFALQDLDEEGKLQIKVPGDAADLVQLQTDGLHRKSTVKYLSLQSEQHNE